MQADLVVLNADPSEDIRALSDVRYTRQRSDAPRSTARSSRRARSGVFLTPDQARMPVNCSPRDIGGGWSGSRAAGEEERAWRVSTRQRSDAPRSTARASRRARSGVFLTPDQAPGRASRARPGSASSSSSPSPIHRPHHLPFQSETSQFRTPSPPPSASSSNSFRNLPVLAWERGHLARIFVFVPPTHRPHHRPIHSETFVPRAGRVAARSSRRIKRQGALRAQDHARIFFLVFPLPSQMRIHYTPQNPRIPKQPTPPPVRRGLSCMDSIL